MQNVDVMQDYLGSLPPIIRKGSFTEFDDLTTEQQESAREMLRGLETDDIYNLFASAFEAINRLGGVVSGNSSPDIDIEFDPQTRQTTWRIRQDAVEEVVSAELGTAEKEYMVYQRKANDEDDNPQYGFDYVRGVPSTEE